MVFDIDSDMMVDSVIDALEEVGARVSEDQFTDIIGKINDTMPGVVQIIAQGMAEHWKSEAKNSGTGWGEKYASIIRYKGSGNKAEVFLDEQSMDKRSGKPNLMFAKMVEEGMKSFDIKTGLLQSEKAKEGPNGIKYIIIPFPVATPRKQGQGSMQSAFGGREMSQEIHSIVRSGGKITAGTKTSSGADITGLTRYNTRQFHSQYGIFRCVSSKSKGWMHPGVPPSPVFPSVLEEVNKKAHEIITTFLKEIVKEYTT